MYVHTWASCIEFQICASTFLSFFYQFQIDQIAKDPERAHLVEKVNVNVDEYLDGLFKKTDSDKDGHVTIQEFERVRDELQNTSQSTFIYCLPLTLKICRVKEIL